MLTVASCRSISSNSASIDLLCRRKRRDSAASFRSRSCINHRGLSGNVQIRKQPTNENIPIKKGTLLLLSVPETPEEKELSD